MPVDRKPHVSRRQILNLSAGAVGAGTVGWLGSGSLARAVSPEATGAVTSDSLVAADLSPGQTLSPGQALQALIDGNKRFVANKKARPNQTLARVAEVAEGQAPFAALLTCADSRVVGEIIFDQGIGDLFTVRVAGNIAVTEVIASLEYAVGVLGSPLLMVLGHERCGAVGAALNGGEYPGMINSFLYAINQAVEDSQGRPGDPLENAIRENVAVELKRLSLSPIIAQRLSEQKLQMVGGYYDLDTGLVELIDYRSA